MKRRPMTKEDHIELKNAFAHLDHHIDIIENKLREHFGKSKLIRKRFERLGMLRPNGTLQNIIGELENYYNDVITDEEYNGPLYVDFKDQYETLQSAL